MSAGPRTPFQNPFVEFIDSRLPIFSLMQKEYGVFPTPRNFNYFWNFGAIAMFMLVTMIVTGIFLAMNYNTSTVGAFDSVEHIMRDVNYGWLLRYIHANGASFFFIAVYVHIFRGMYYGSYKRPREILWILGVVIFLLMMATAFMGYVLPWGQMSFWGATVITNLFSAIPVVGDDIVTLLWGGFSVDNPTLNRFFALHFLLPFVIFGVVFLHIWALHVTGSNNPTGLDVKGPQDTLPFHPYYTMKDTFGLLVFLVLYCAYIFFMPNALGHPDNYTPANPMVTPPHIVPEWYFLPYYAILRSFTFNINPLIVVGLVGLAAYVWRTIWSPVQRSFTAPKELALLVVGGLLAAIGIIGGLSPHFGIPLTHINLAEAKLVGVLAMFGSIAMLLIMPWLDWHPVRSARYRPLFKITLLAFVAATLILGYCGASVADAKIIAFDLPRAMFSDHAFDTIVTGGKPSDYIFFKFINNEHKDGIEFMFTSTHLSLMMSLYYFGFFLVILPFLSRHEKAKPLPQSISAAVLEQQAKSCCGHGHHGHNHAHGYARLVVLAVLAIAALVASSVTARANEGGELPKQEWSFNGPFGTYDKAALQRGYKVYREVCSSCHSMKRVSFRNLEALGYSEAEIKSIAAEYTVTDGPNDEGEMFDRPARPSDHFKSPFANENAAKYANNGALPPDLSLITKARHGGADYVYGILTGFDEPPAGMTLLNGQHWNKAMPGHIIAMAKPLTDGQIAYDDGSPQTVDQYARDVAQFLTWTAEPEMESRKRMGVKVILFLVVFSGIMYAVKRKIWAKVH